MKIKNSICAVDLQRVYYNDGTMFFSHLTLIKNRKSELKTAEDAEEYKVVFTAENAEGAEGYKIVFTAEVAEGAEEYKVVFTTEVAEEYRIVITLEDAEI